MFLRHNAARHKCGFSFCQRCGVNRPSEGHNDCFLRPLKENTKELRKTISFDFEVTLVFFSL